MSAGLYAAWAWSLGAAWLAGREGPGLSRSERVALAFWPVCAPIFGALNRRRRRRRA